MIAMSVLMLLRVPGNGAQFEKAAADDPGRISTIIASARAHGLQSHHFWADDKDILVVDVWPDEASFQAFFSSESDRIDALMAAAGVTTQPDVSFYRKLDIGDDV
ncbi:hypothetical protein AB0F91_16060 [Amycolatopsis sp. NPDC023774]|uniref:antibiotic biosynthesis monooxygenase family protein n=1 Tax=Amycolatopsis sp. NPDC023774 TaxID=3155015 RepID=UPI0033DA9EA1